MRRSIAIVIGLVASLLAAGQLSGTSPTAGAATGDLTSTGSSQARHALAQARAALGLSRADGPADGPADGRARTGGQEATGDASMALTRLFQERSALGGADRRAADALLGRPTDGSKDPYGDGYTVPATVLCSQHICLHWVTTTNDAPPNRAWARATLKTLGQVWAVEIGKLGYHPPIADRTRGGDNRLDVYLKNVGVKGYYGYCAPERYKPGSHHLASGFCVLDNDFSTVEFGAPPMLSLKVTAAHEFFHAVQYAYDVNEDHWMMEATATWMEERFADGANDNRQYLREPAAGTNHAQLRTPSAPLDTFSDVAQYGNWIFFELLSQKYGVGVVRSIWREAAGFAGAPNKYSVAAVRTVIANRGGVLSDVYAAFAGGNTIPEQTYSEGAFYIAAPLAQTLTPSEAAPTTGAQYPSLDHLSSTTVALTPDAGLTDPAWQVSISFDLPVTAAGSAAYVIVHHTDGTIAKAPVTLDATGAATITRPFSAATVSAVTVTLANGSSRSTCWTGDAWACHGTPLDDHQTYTWSAALVPLV